VFVAAPQRTLATVFSWEHAEMTRRGPSRRRLSGSLRRRQGSALRADAFGADGLDRASSEPTRASYVMALVCDPADGSSARWNEDVAGVGATGISIARCRELLGDEADSMTDQEIVEIRRHAETLACIVIDTCQKHCKSRG
jgi:hypothetical protein